MMSQAEQRENNKPKSIKLTFSYKTANLMLFKEQNIVLLPTYLS